MKLQAPIELHVQWLEDQLNATEMVLFKIQDENARLREALEKVAGRPHEPYCAWLDPGPEKCNCWLSVAQVALEGK